MHGLVQLIGRQWPEVALLSVIAAIYSVNLGLNGLFEAPHEMLYAQSGRELLATGWAASGGLPVFNQQPLLTVSPGLPWLVSGAYQLFGVHFFAARLPTLLAAAGAVAGVGWLATRWYDNRATRLLAMIMVATCWGFFRAAHLALPDTLALWLSLLVLGLVAPEDTLPRRYQRARPRGFPHRSLWVGILFGGLGLCGGWQHSIVMAGIIGLSVLIQPRSVSLERVRWPWLLAGFGMVFVPWATLWMLQGQLLAAFRTNTLPWGSLTDFANLLWHGMPWGGLMMGALLYRLLNRLRPRVVQRGPFSPRHPETLLWVWLGVGLVVQSLCPLLWLPPMCLLTASSLNEALMAPRLSRILQVSLDGTLLMLLAGAVMLSVILFQWLPGQYPGAEWLLPGPPAWELVSLKAVSAQLPSIEFPLWKAWLIPFPLLLMLTGLLMVGLMAMRRPGVAVGALAISALAWGLLINGIAKPVFQYTAATSAIAETLNTRRSAPDSLCFVGTPTRLGKAMAHTLYHLRPPAGAAPIRFVSPQPPQKQIGCRYEVIEAHDYYARNYATRQQASVLAHEWHWDIRPLWQRLNRWHSPKPSPNAGISRNALLLIHRTGALPDTSTR